MLGENHIEQARLDPKNTQRHHQSPDDLRHKRERHQICYLCIAQSNAPRLHDAIIQTLSLLAQLPGGTPGEREAIEAFVLDFSDAYWQVPIQHSEQLYFCATGLIKGRRKYFAFLRAAQGSLAAGTFWALWQHWL